MNPKSDFALMMEMIEDIEKQIKNLESISREIKQIKEKLNHTKDGFRGKERHSHSPQMRDDGICYYCKFHQRYEIESDMVLSNGKSKGYCKAGISIWNKLNNKREILAYKINRIDSIFKRLDIQALQIELKEYQDKFNNPKYYDYERDWEKFREKSK